MGSEILNSYFCSPNEWHQTSVHVFYAILCRKEAGEGRGREREGEEEERREGRGGEGREREMYSLEHCLSGLKLCQFINTVSNRPLN